jgi:sulfide:quinone oxidoreductase
MAQRTFCILGGGITGIITARELRRHLGPENRIVIIDKNDSHSFPPSFLWIALGWRKPEVISQPLSLLEKHGIEIFQSPVLSIHPSDKRIVTPQGEMRYDACIAALGTQADPETPHPDEQRFHTVPQALRLRDALSGFRGGDIAIVVHSRGHVWPAAQYEAAFLLQAWCQQRGIGPVSIKIFTPEARPLDWAGPQASAALQALLDERRICVEPDRRLTTIRGETRECFFENSAPARFDLLVGIPGPKAPDVLSTTGMTGPGGWIPVDPRTLSTAADDFYVAGDSARLTSASGAVLPGTAVFAFTQAEVISHRLIHQGKSAEPLKEFSPASFLFIETGQGRASMLHGNFLPSSAPSLLLNPPSVASHWGKVLAEKYWLWRWL